MRGVRDLKRPVPAEPVREGTLGSHAEQVSPEPSTPMERGPASPGNPR